MRIHFANGFAIALILFIPSFSFSQLNMVLQDSVTYTVGVNDICGWAAPDGKEYALVGLNTGVAIVDINEDTLREVVFVPGVNNLWRDINTYGHYAYVSSEAYIGLLIIDLQFLPDSVQTYVWRDSLPTQNGPQTFEKAHTLWTDENGLLYLNGSNLNGGGVIMLDVASSPTDPVFLGYAPPIYSHDIYTRDSIIYSAEIYAGDLSIYDAHDPNNITLIGRVKTPHEFTHNAWLSDNGQYMYTTDERSNSYVAAYDISDLGNITEVDRYRQASTEGLGNIVHNVYVLNDWLVVAYYANGTTIVDASRPDNLVEVGYFDSFLGPDGGFPGVWGSFPWLPSGKILTSDRNSGLYVFHPNYVRACFLEGTVIDAVTGLPIVNAQVTIQSDEIVNPEVSKLNGIFKMGKAIPGTYDVLVTKEGYYDKIVSFDFINGEVLTPVIELDPLQVYSFSGHVIDQDNANVPFAKVSLVNDEGTYEITSDENGQFIIPLVNAGSYALQAGVWGNTFEGILDMNEPKNLTIQLVPGYRDDFDVDLGWIVSGHVTSGDWVRELPSQQLLFESRICGSEGDSPYDIGGFAYSTGASFSADVQDVEVSGGTTWLISPPMDLTGAIAPKISFDYWLCEFPPNQYVGLHVWITNGMDTFLLDQITNDTINGSWQSKLYTDLPLQAPLDVVQFMVSATDTTSGQSDYILKVHIDNFKLMQSGLANNDPYVSGNYFRVYPNPISGSKVYIKPTGQLAGKVVLIKLFDLHGRMVSAHQVSAHEDVISIDHKMEDGMYFMQWQTENGDLGVEKVMVIRN